MVEIVPLAEEVAPQKEGEDMQQQQKNGLETIRGNMHTIKELFHQYKTIKELVDPAIVARIDDCLAWLEAGIKPDGYLDEMVAIDAQVMTNLYEAMEQEKLGQVADGGESIDHHKEIPVFPHTQITGERLHQERHTFITKHTDILTANDTDTMLATCRELFTLVKQEPQNLDYFETAIIFLEHLIKRIITGEEIEEIDKLLAEANTPGIQMFDKLTYHYFDITGNPFLQYHTHHKLGIGSTMSRDTDMILLDNMPSFALLDIYFLSLNCVKRNDIDTLLGIYGNVVSSVNIISFPDIQRAFSKDIQWRGQLLLQTFEFIFLEAKIAYMQDKDDPAKETPESLDAGLTYFVDKTYLLQAVHHIKTLHYTQTPTQSLLGEIHPIIKEFLPTLKQRYRNEKEREKETITNMSKYFRMIVHIGLFFENNPLEIDACFASKSPLAHLNDQQKKAVDIELRTLFKVEPPKEQITLDKQEKDHVHLTMVMQLLQWYNAYLPVLTHHQEILNKELQQHNGTYHLVKVIAQATKIPESTVNKEMVNECLKILGAADVTFQEHLLLLSKYLYTHQSHINNRYTISMMRKYLLPHSKHFETYKQKKIYMLKHYYTDVADALPNFTQEARKKLHGFIEQCIFEASIERRDLDIAEPFFLDRTPWSDDIPNSSESLQKRFTTQIPTHMTQEEEELLIEEMGKNDDMLSVIHLEVQGKVYTLNKVEWALILSIQIGKMLLPPDILLNALKHTEGSQIEINRQQIEKAIIEYLDAISFCKLGLQKDVSYITTCINQVEIEKNNIPITYAAPVLLKTLYQLPKNTPIQLTQETMMRYYISAYVNMVVGEQAVLKTEYFPEIGLQKLEQDKHLLAKMFIDIYFSEKVPGTNYEKLTTIFSMQPWENIEGNSVVHIGTMKQRLIGYAWKARSEYVIDQENDILSTLSSEESLTLLQSAEEHQNTDLVYNISAFTYVIAKLSVQAKQYKKAQRMVSALAGTPYHDELLDDLKALKLVLQKDFEGYLDVVHADTIEQLIKEYLNEQDQKNGLPTDSLIKTQENGQEAGENKNKNNKHKMGNQTTDNYLKKILLMKYKDMLGDSPIADLSDEDLRVCLLKYDTTFHNKQIIPSLEIEQADCQIAADSLQERMVKGELFEITTLLLGQRVSLFSNEKKDLKYQLRKDTQDGTYKIVDFEQDDIWEMKLGGNATYSLSAVEKYQEFVGTGDVKKLRIVTMENNRMISRLLREKNGHEQVNIYPIDKMLPYCLYQVGDYLFSTDQLPNGLDSTKERAGVAQYAYENIEIPKEDISRRLHHWAKMKLQKCAVGNQGTSSATAYQEQIHNAKQERSYRKAIHTIEELSNNIGSYDFLNAQADDLDTYLQETMKNLFTQGNDAITPLLMHLEQVTNHPAHVVKRIYGLWLTEIQRRIQAKEQITEQLKNFQALMPELLQIQHTLSQQDIKKFCNTKDGEFMGQLQALFLLLEKKQLSTKGSSVVLEVFTHIQDIVLLLRSGIYDVQALTAIQVLLWDVYKDITLGFDFMVDGKLGNSTLAQALGQRRKSTCTGIAQKLKSIKEFMQQLHTTLPDKKNSDASSILGLQQTYTKELFPEAQKEIETQYKYLYRKKDGTYALHWICTLPSLDVLVSHKHNKKNSLHAETSPTTDKNHTEHIDSTDYKHNEKLQGSISNNLNLVLHSLEKIYNTQATTKDSIWWFTIEDIVDHYIKLAEKNEIVHRRHATWQAFASEKKNSSSVDKQMEKLGLDPHSQDKEVLKKRLELKLLQNLFAGSSDQDAPVDRRFLSYKKGKKRTDQRYFGRNYQYLIHLNYKRQDIARQQFNEQVVNGLEKTNQEYWKICLAQNEVVTSQGTGEGKEEEE